MDPDLLRRCRSMVDTLDLPNPWNLLRFVQLLAERRGRPLHLLPVDTAGGLHGLLISTGQADYIAYEQHTTRPHQQQLILHEIGHLLWGHPARNLLELDSIRPRRVPYRREQEEQAEITATLINQAAALRTKAQPAAVLLPEPQIPDEVRRVLETYVPGRTPTDGGGVPGPRRVVGRAPVVVPASRPARVVSR